MQKKDRSAYVELFKMYERYLYSICYSYTQNEQDSLDLVQESYLKVFNGMAGFDESMPFHPWIRRICVNTCLNFRRGIKNNIISLNKDDDSESSYDEKYVSDCDVEDTVEKMETREIIKKGLKDLPENYRMALVLRYYDDMSYQEISELLRRPLGTVKTDIYRAKAMLKKNLEGRLEV